MLKLSSVPCGAAGGCDTSPGVCARLRVGPAGLLAVLSGCSCTAVTSGFCESECDCCSSSHPEGVKPADSSLSETAASHRLWGSLPLPAGHAVSCTNVSKVLRFLWAHAQGTACAVAVPILHTQGSTVLWLSSCTARVESASSSSRAAWGSLVLLCSSVRPGL